jgi:hypothetical protein
MGRGRRLEHRGQISIFYFGPAELENRDLTPSSSSSITAVRDVARLSIELVPPAFAAEGLVQALGELAEIVRRLSEVLIFFLELLFLLLQLLNGLLALIQIVELVRLHGSSAGDARLPARRTPPGLGRPPVRSNGHEL